MAVNPDISSLAFRLAVMSVQKRAEKISDWKRLRDLFVPTDVWERVNATDSQLILGRRGTGKTHLLRAFQDDCVTHGQYAIYMDCTRLGSGYSGLDLPPLSVGSKYFTSFLNALGTELHNYAVDMERPDVEVQTALSHSLVDAFVPLMDPGANQTAGSLFNYAQIARTLEFVIRKLGIGRLYVILDEWAQVPFKVQPYLADLIKRSVNIVSEVSLKVLAVNYQCQFSELVSGTVIGMERGADFPDVIDMDTYLVPAERPEFVANFFSQVLYNHVGIELGWDLDLSHQEKRVQVERIFTQRDTFLDLVRAAEGNCRDFLCIFGKAYFDEFRQSGASKSLSKPNIASAATEWFDSEKLANIKGEREVVDTLAFIMDKVLKGYKSRTFLVESGKSSHPRLTRLLNERVLHRLNGQYSSPARPGVRYDILTVDYGAFIRFRGTGNEVDEAVFLQRPSPNENREVCETVPVDDKRSIRRIIFDPEELTIDGYAKTYNAGDVDLPLWRSGRTV